MDYSLPGSSVLGILQARILEWIAMLSSRVLSHPRDQICMSCVSCIGRQVLYHLGEDIIQSIARRFLMTNLDSILKSRDITLPTMVCLVKAMVFPVVMYGRESWTVKKAEVRGVCDSEEGTGRVRRSDDSVPVLKEVG